MKNYAEQYMEGATPQGRARAFATELEAIYKLANSEVFDEQERAREYLRGLANNEDIVVVRGVLAILLRDANHPAL